MTARPAVPERAPRRPQRLSQTDAAFLAAETNEWHMHNGVLAVFSGADAAGRLGPEELRSLVTGRLAHLGLFRRRVVEMPGRLDRPEWEDTPELDVGAHLRHATVDPPGGSRELGRLVGALFEESLDRSRPLWELWRIDGLDDGGVALLLKIHHACIDGLRGAEYASVIFDVDPAAPLERPDLARELDQRRGAPLARVSASALAVATTPVRVARVGMDALRAVPRLARFAVSAERAASVLPFQAPPGPFNAELTSRRVFASASVSLADVNLVRHSFHVSVNDVVLAMCSGAFRAYLEDRHSLPARAMVAQVPMAIHRDEHRADPSIVPGNLLSAMGAALPVHLDGAGDRIRAVHASTVATRALQRALGDDLLADLAGVVPPLVLSALVRAYERLHLDLRLPPIYNAIVSNVPGPPVPLYCGGARLTHGYLLGPLLVAGGLNITVISYVDSIEIGIVACPDVVDDPWTIAQAMEPALAELVRAAGAEPTGGLDA
jgi:diacylglycerol O-acyltransferase / wax synthase